MQEKYEEYEDWPKSIPKPSLPAGYNWVMLRPALGLQNIDGTHPWIVTVKWKMRNGRERILKIQGYFPTPEEAIESAVKSAIEHAEFRKSANERNQNHPPTPRLRTTRRLRLTGGSVMADIDHEYTSEIVCPHCGQEWCDSWEILTHDDKSVKMECDDCGNEFVATCCITVDYKTRKISCKEEGHQWRIQKLWTDDKGRNLMRRYCHECLAEEQAYDPEWGIL